ncbi:MAG: hypothetical protein PHS62_05305 [Patescibacteria group bacterium]|nr:hypothetical protein [Patescibacteria group bacterium]
MKAKQNIKQLVNDVLAKRPASNLKLSGFKSKKWDGTSNICDCGDDGDCCSE